MGAQADPGRRTGNGSGNDRPGNDGPWPIVGGLMTIGAGGHPDIAKNGPAAAVVSPNVASRIDGASAGSKSASVSDGVVGVAGFGTGRGKKASEGQGSDCNKCLDHGVVSGGYLRLDAAVPVPIQWNRSFLVPDPAGPHA